MAKKNTAAPADDLLGGGDDDLLGTAPAKKTAAAKTAPAKKAAAAKTAAAAPAAKTAAPAKKAAKPAADAGEAGPRAERGTGKYFFDPAERDALAKQLEKLKKPATTKELAKKLETDTWKIRLALAKVLVPAGKGTLEKVGNVLTYTPA